MSDAIKLSFSLRRAADMLVATGADRGDVETALHNAVVVGISLLPSKEAREVMLEHTIRQMRKGMAELEKSGLLKDEVLPAGPALDALNRMKEAQLCKE